MDTTDVPTKTATKLKRIAWLSSRDERKVFNSLMHLFNKSPSGTVSTSWMERRQLELMGG